MLKNSRKKDIIVEILYVRYLVFYWNLNRGNYMRVLKVLAIASVIGIATGCASSSDIDKLQSEIDGLKDQISTASSDAAKAQSSAAEAASKAASAESAANRAAKYAEDTNSKLDRMFKKSMMK